MDGKGQTAFASIWLKLQQESIQIDDIISLRQMTDGQLPYSSKKDEKKKSSPNNPLPQQMNKIIISGSTYPFQKDKKRRETKIGSGRPNLILSQASPYLTLHKAWGSH